MIEAKGGKKRDLHRPVRSKLADPYLSNKGIPEPAICPNCHAVYHKKSWTFDPKALTEAKKDPEAHSVKCPACRKIEDNYPLGVVHLSGDFVFEHKDEIIGLIKNDEKRAMERNPLERIMKIEKKSGELYIETTTDDLALRIGHALCRAYKGSEAVHSRFENKYVIVNWSR